jgi:hypothetical protein
VTRAHDTRLAGSPPPFSPSVVVSRVSGRRPEWKAHTSMRQAHQAMAYHRAYSQTVEVWEHRGGDWNLVGTSGEAS